MSKVYYFMTTTIGIVVLMYLAGITFIGQSEIFTWLGINADNLLLNSGYFIAAAASLFVLGAAAGAILANRESAFRAGIAGGMLTIGSGAFISILNHIKSIVTTTDQWVYTVVFVMFAVYMVGFIISLIEWWGGTG